MSLTMPKKLGRETLWDFSTSILSQSSKTVEKDPLGIEKMLTSQKKMEGHPSVSPGMVCYAEKRKNLFGSVPWANRYNLAPSFEICRTCSRTILVTSSVSKKKPRLVDSFPSFNAIRFHFVKTKVLRKHL